MTEIVHPGKQAGQGGMSQFVVALPTCESRTGMRTAGQLIQILDLRRRAALDALGQRRFDKAVDLAVQNR